MSRLLDLHSQPQPMGACNSDHDRLDLLMSTDHITEQLLCALRCFTKEPDDNKVEAMLQFSLKWSACLQRGVVFHDHLSGGVPS